MSAMKRCAAALVVMVVALSGCVAECVDCPPAVRLGDSVCHECGMIISDERFATATIVDGPRGAEPLLFDDFNCQINFEVKTEPTVRARWSHDYSTSNWLRSKDAHFLLSPELRTPMASHMAAFASEAELKAAQGALGGEMVSFDLMLGRAELAMKNAHADAE